MTFYDDERCPICGKQFEPDDDVVTCPECGTPHHRACYNELGHCANIDKHGTDFEFERHIPQQETADEQAQIRNEQAQQGRRFSPLSQPTVIVDMYSPATQELIRNNPQIDGKNTKEIASAIATNTDKILPRFISGRKLSWNWAAFIFGPYYLAFRKMLKEAVLFLTLKIAASVGIQALFIDEMNALSDFINKNYDAISSGKITSDIISQLQPYSDKLMPMFMILAAFNLAMHIFIALTADGMYKKRIFRFIDRIERSINEGGVLSETSSPNAPRMSQDEMKKFYLRQLGGTSFFTPIMLFLFYDMITTFISRL